MDITRSIVYERNRALLGGDHDSYHAQTSRKIHKLRKRVGIATPKGRKYTPKSSVTAENVGRNQEWVQLLLTSSERAWASAMAMKSNQSAENTQKPIPGSTKRRIVSRLRKSILYAENLVSVLKDRNTSHATAIDELEGNAYMALLKGGLAFEKSQWQQCLQQYSIARLIYSSLESGGKSEIYKELLSSTIDPSIRYAAYQSKISRTKPIEEIIVERFPSSETHLQSEIKKINPQAFEVGVDDNSEDGPKDVPSSITWRNRQVKFEDSSIRQMLGIAKEREDALYEKAKTVQQGSSITKELVSAYDDVLTARQDVVDATKSAIDEMIKEGVDPGDAKMQSLQITRTAVNYAVIEWRIGRNRFLCGSQDGLLLETEESKQLSKPRKDGKSLITKEERSGRKISKLRERLTLYDSILQSLDSVNELPGVMADTELVKELDGKKAYFRALKCLSIGRYHAITNNVTNALALYSQALSVAQDVSPTVPSQKTSTTSLPPKLEISTTQWQDLIQYLKPLVTKYHALADLQKLSSTSKKSEVKRPLIERLYKNEYEDPIDLTNLVDYPPKLQPIPVKPIFFDLAWNYIQYPGRKNDVVNVVVGRSNAASGKTTSNQDEKPKTRGWFGFGR